MTNLVISGSAALGDGNGSVQKVNNLWETDQAFSWVKGSHEWKFGFNFMSTRFAFSRLRTPMEPIASMGRTPVTVWRISYMGVRSARR